MQISSRHVAEDLGHHLRVGGEALTDVAEKATADEGDPSMAEVAGLLDAPVRHSSQVPTICTMTCAAENRRSAAISSITASTSELRNSDERWQMVQMR